MKTIDVRVGWLDIIRGHCINTKRCPTAIALKRAIGKVVGVVGDDFTIYLPGGGYKICSLPVSVSAWIRDFDGIMDGWGENRQPSWFRKVWKMRPISFQVEIPE